jgi:predicted CXXCH cytochrome family protein
MADWDAPRYAVTLGVSCEACHLGSKAHVESGGKTPPEFFPVSPQLFVESSQVPDPGRTHDNINWSCARCHTGTRPAFAAGMSTWNSVEYADAAKGSCYTKLRCIDCHDPHQALGPKWTHPPERDDAACLKCHTTYQAAEKRSAHTHHPAGSAGDRCLNCHMPRINEGIQDVVRTHMIYSPTRPDMILANHPNACNLCHTDRSIDWTLESLKNWYGKTYDDRELSRNYRDRSGPAAVGWLASTDPSVRLVGADALTRTRSIQALPKLIDTLDDPYLLTRQFTGKGLEEMLGVRLNDFGYHFYQSRDERKGPLQVIRGKRFEVGKEK